LGLDGNGLLIAEKGKKSSLGFAKPSVKLFYPGEFRTEKLRKGRSISAIAQPASEEVFGTSSSGGTYLRMKWEGQVWLEITEGH